MTLIPEKSTLLLPLRPALPIGARPFRVGVVAGQSPPPAWVDALLSFLKEVPGMDVLLLALVGGPPASSIRPSRLTERLYSESRKRFDPFGDLPVNEAREATVESIDRIRSAGCDVLIWLAGHKEST